MERKSVSTSNLPEGKQRSNLIQKLYENFLPTKQNYAPSIEVACEQKDEQKIIAIIGMGCRLSGGINSPEELWSNALVKGRSLAEPVPFSRWDVEADGANDGDIRSRTSQGAFVKDAEYFDPPTFKISMIEAENMDPQHRLLLECSYLALLDAGYSKGLSELRGKNVGVFIGISGSDMVEVNLMNKKIKRASVYEAYNAASSSASGRVSFVFNFKGPCVTFDAACSSSLVALHAGMQSLKNGECDLAVVAGVNIMLTSTVLKSYGLAKMTSPTGRCHTFDSSADGYLRGEGCAAVVLKSLDAAVEESVESFNSQVSKSSFHAVLSAVRVKHDGTSASFTAPNLDAQTNLVYEARNYPEFNLEHKDIDYFECHGTGTPLGDPVEIEAIVSALNRQKTERHNNQTVSFGSAKANIGHLEAGAGLAGLIAAILVLKHEKAPPNAALTELNPRIKRIIENSGIKCSFQTKLTSLRDITSKPENHPLIAGISSFGYAGAIAHAIIRQPKVFHVREKKIKTAQSLLLFTGQGSQYPRMGQKLYHENQDFRKAMDRCNTIYQKFNNVQSLLENIFTLSALEKTRTALRRKHVMCRAIRTGDAPLEFLDVSGNELTKKGAKHVADIMEEGIGGTLKVLHCEENELTSRGASYIADKLPPGTQEIRLGFNECDSVGAQALTKRCSSDNINFSDLKRIHLDGNVSNEFSYDISCVKSTRFSTQHYFCCRHFLLCFFLFLCFSFYPCCYYDKKIVANKVLQFVRESGGRFLEEIGEHWVDVGDKKACDKARMALCGRAQSQIKIMLDLIFIYELVVNIKLIDSIFFVHLEF